jgi:alanyl-tRNA synthetase
MTERLYYHDCYLPEFRARIIAASADHRTVYLDRTAFYPASGGQPFDFGFLNEVAVNGVEEEEDGRIAHQLAAPLDAAEAHGVIDWPRRFDHMQQHTGQHLLSAVIVELYSIPTLSFHMGGDVSTIDIGAPSLDAEQVRRIEERANEVVFQNRPVAISFEENPADLRKASAREGTLRVVTIQDLDRSACGGTHVRSTGEIGAILIRKLDKMRGNVRLEFVCGGRAARRASADYRLLSQMSKSLSASLDELPDLVKSLSEKNAAADKQRRKLSEELAGFQGRELYLATAPGTGGIRRHTHRGPITDDVRALAAAFTAGSQAVFLALSSDSPSLLLACSADSGVHAGNQLRAAVSANGGRGGGSQTMAQGSVPSKEALEAIAASLL